MWDLALFALLTLQALPATHLHRYKKELIAYYNLNKGFNTIKPWASGNCCFAVKGGDRLTISDTRYNIQFPASTSKAIRCSPTGGYNEQKYRLYREDSIRPEQVFGSTTESCIHSHNPALFVHEHLDFAIGDAENAPTGGWAQMTVADLTRYQTPLALQYNAGSGLPLTASFQSGNCCVSVKGGQMLTIAGTKYGYAFPATGAAADELRCNQANGYQSPTSFRFYAVPTLLADVAGGHSFASRAACATNHNPSVFMKRDNGGWRYCPAGSFVDMASDPSCCKPCDSVPCPAGQWRVGCGYADAGTCAACPAGTFQLADDDAVCTGCPEGTYSSVVGLVYHTCYDCPAGQYSRMRHTECLHCPAGKFSAAAKSGGCLSCEGGQYAAAQGLSACPHCPAGRFSEMDAEGYLRTACYDCPAGKYQAASRSTSCDDCDACHTSTAPGATSCSTSLERACATTNYSAWGTCPVVCGAGSKARTRSVVTAGRCGGQPCPALVDSAPCQSAPCPCAAVSCALSAQPCGYGNAGHGACGNATTSTPMRIRVHHPTSVQWQSELTKRTGVIGVMATAGTLGGHHCKLVAGACKCNCHDQFSAANGYNPKLEDLFDTLPGI
jgi:hypothetical protein